MLQAKNLGTVLAYGRKGNECKLYVKSATKTELKAIGFDLVEMVAEGYELTEITMTNNNEDKPVRIFCYNPELIDITTMIQRLIHSVE